MSVVIDFSWNHQVGYLRQFACVMVRSDRSWMRWEWFVSDEGANGKTKAHGRICSGWFIQYLISLNDLVWFPFALLIDSLRVLIAIIRESRGLCFCFMFYVLLRVFLVFSISSHLEMFSSALRSHFRHILVLVMAFLLNCLLESVALI